MTEHLDPRITLDEVAAVRQGVRADLHAVSTPLLAVGATSAALLLLVGDGRSSSGLGALVWAAGLPLAFGALAVRERCRATAAGVAGSRRGYSVAAIALLASAVLGVPLLFLLGPFVYAGVALVALGLAHHRLRLAGWALTLAALGTAESFYAVSNRFATYYSWLHTGVLVGVALLFVVAGLVERRREHA